MHYASEQILPKERITTKERQSILETMIARILVEVQLHQLIKIEALLCTLFRISTELLHGHSKQNLAPPASLSYLPIDLLS